MYKLHNMPESTLALDPSPHPAYRALAEGIHRFIRMKGWI
ncbi:hypothetical protein XTGART2_0168 [Xanthomonas translucens pv. graminis]|jgi:hypothetical protein|nr:hypothetical protein XTGART9_0170 [Xanthomonas translucens pv. graminis]SBV38804.1 hypothetical protein XTGART2_0168 [Xanthomonas translucens pv. graminis]SBV45578.1 hypothetical protein XTGART29_0190 [Xanthomonas translucens pv. graminis ART-Xtg29]SBV53568.1 hypothetical protein XTGART10_0169 [Xanthomonas translucens pv. graminis]SBV57025.1 hypothetical protein XTGICMP6431_0171 [Xanthomonas translucens pv. graminis]